MQKIAMELSTFCKSYEKVHFKENEIYFSITSMLIFLTFDSEKINLTLL